MPLFKLGTPAALFGGILFSLIGSAAFIYGRRQGSFRACLIGALLSAYPFFVANTALIYATGSFLTLALFFFRD